MLGKIDPTSKEISEKERRELEMQVMTKQYLNSKKKTEKGSKTNIITK